MAYIYSLLLVTTLALRGSQAASDCQNSVQNKTIAYFSSAPMTFSYELATVWDCQKWCEKLPECQAWVYIEQSNQCDLHRTPALSVSDNAGFIFGGCMPDAINASTKLAPTPTPSLHPFLLRTPAASDTVASIHTKRDLFRHKHKHRH
ncbi:hypothetical protein POX_d05700 [Penicillium oxalicum]|uniref:hypothetical protein n=1 Tax=Penicillium oxalicum TaxID=69781 RepID=UPI0020B6B270|nr:hypothetical protein POX_d05700 [Penicillium oxalicum]KAI2790194.1 hypothetical protein POX_d05700 [Penicillium oxalicum]